MVNSNRALIIYRLRNISGIKIENRHLAYCILIVDNSSNINGINKGRSKNLGLTYSVSQKNPP